MKNLLSFFTSLRSPSLQIFKKNLANNFPLLGLLLDRQHLENKVISADSFSKHIKEINAIYGYIQVVQHINNPNLKPNTYVKLSDY